VHKKVNSIIILKALKLIKQFLKMGKNKE